MKAKIDVVLKPFQVPNYVLTEQLPGVKQDGLREGPKYALSELDPDTLAKLCEDFTQAIFKKAGKQRPPRGLT